MVGVHVWCFPFDGKWECWNGGTKLVIWYYLQLPQELLVLAEIKFCHNNLCGVVFWVCYISVDNMGMSTYW